LIWQGRNHAVVLGIPGRELTTNARRISWIRLRKFKIALLPFAILAAFIIAIFGFLPLLTPIPGFLRGFIAGFAIAVAVALLVWVALIGDGSMTWRVGALGELWTSEELRRLGKGWVILNGLRVPAADDSLREIDHIAIGPGGVFVVDTKTWLEKRNRLGQTDAPYVAAAAKGAMRQAKIVQLFLADTVQDRAVFANLMFWGSGLSSAAAAITTTRDGVRIVHGRDSGAWLEAARSNDLLDESQVLVIRERLVPYLIVKQRFRSAIPPRDWNGPGGQASR